MEIRKNGSQNRPRMPPPVISVFSHILLCQEMKIVMGEPKSHSDRSFAILCACGRQWRFIHSRLIQHLSLCLEPELPPNSSPGPTGQKEGAGRALGAVPKSAQPRKIIPGTKKYFVPEKKVLSLKHMKMETIIILVALPPHNYTQIWCLPTFFFRGGS